MARLRTLLAALDPLLPVPVSRDACVASLAALLHGQPADRVWLTLSVLRAELPTGPEVVQWSRTLRELDANVAIDQILKSARHGLLGRVPSVVVVTGMTVIDVHHTAQTTLATGIQRVVRKCLQIWNAEHEITMLGWSADYSRIRRLTADEIENALHGTVPHLAAVHQSEVTVPWRCVYVLPELATEPDRTARIGALAEFSGNYTVVVGHDCVPFTTAETTAPGMASVFAKNLAAVANFDRVAATSIASTREYLGWKSMLPNIGKVGPEVRRILLAAEPEAVSAPAVAAARDVLLVDELPMLLCVGSHEPRKNHLAVLHAAEVLWRQGRQFSLTFVGGNSWGADAFKLQLDTLKSQGRPVQTISAITDELLWSGYELATCTVFPSLNEGFGLPVAESLSAGTPVVTSAFGSMAEIAEAGGAILIDPRDDAALLRGIETGLFDEVVRDRLRAEAAARTPRMWTEYASELWDFVHEKANMNDRFNL